MVDVRIARIFIELVDGRCAVPEAKTGDKKAPGAIAPSSAGAIRLSVTIPKRASAPPPSWECLR